MKALILVLTFFSLISAYKEIHCSSNNTGKNHVIQKLTFYRSPPFDMTQNERPECDITFQSVTFLFYF